MAGLLTSKAILLQTINMKSLFESQRRTDNAFRIAGAVAIDESHLVLYAGSMKGLVGQFGVKAAPAWYTQSSHNIRIEGIIRSSYRGKYGK